MHCSGRRLLACRANLLSFQKKWFHLPQPGCSKIRDLCPISVPSMSGIFARAPTCYLYDYEGAWRWCWRGSTRRVHIEAAAAWALEVGLELSCTFIWWDSVPPSWEEWEDERWHARREWEKWQRQKVLATCLSCPSAEVLHIVQPTVCQPAWRTSSS